MPSKFSLFIGRGTKASMWSEVYTESILGNCEKAGHRAQSAPTSRGLGDAGNLCFYKKIYF